VATGGETSISGTDADGKTLSYTVGLEQVFLNGVNLVRGQDYTATNGTSVGALTALVASDVVEVFAFVPFNIANALTVSTVDAKGDLLVGTGADAVGRLSVGTTADQQLVVDSSTASGLKWGAPSGLVLLKTVSIGSAVSSINVDNVFDSTYDQYKIVVASQTGSSAGILAMRLRVSSSDNTSSNYRYGGIERPSGTSTIVYYAGNTATYWVIGTRGYESGIFEVNVNYPYAAYYPSFFASGGASDNTNARGFMTTLGGGMTVNTSYTGFTVFPDGGTITGGQITVYGVRK
jgi:hypothetical protein